MFDFPSSPTEGQTTSGPGGITYEFRSGRWVVVFVPNDADDLYVNAAGDTMTGALLLPADPTLALQAATKQYVDASGGGGASVTISDTPPASPAAGDLWFNSATLILFVWYDDSTSSQWVQVVPTTSGSASAASAYQFTKLTKLHVATPTSVPNNAYTLMSAWSAVFDEGGVFSAGTPARITIPSGYTKCRMRTFTVFAANGTNMRGVYWYKNGAGLMITMGKAGWGGGLNFETGWLSVGAGDYFEQQVYQDSGGALNFSPGTASSQGGIAWWEIELAP